MQYQRKSSRICIVEIAKPTLGLLLLVCFLAFTPASAKQTRAQDKPVETPKALVEEVAGILDSDLAAPVGPGWEYKRTRVLVANPQNIQDARDLLASLLQLVQDPNTRLLTPSDLQALQNELARTSATTGITDLTVHRGNPEGELVLVTPVAGSSAAAAGLKPGDVIVSVGGSSTAPMSRSQVMQVMRGETGSVVDVGIRRGKETIQVRLKREVNSTPAVSSSVLNYSGSKYGYVVINEFSSVAGEQAREAVNNQLNLKVAGLILDLRQNPGGLLDSAVQTGAIFSDQKLLCSIVRRNGQIEPRELKGAKLTDLALVVLVDEGTASAAEVLAAALQDSHRATVVGKKTFGQGYVYAVHPLAEGSALLVASGILQRPNGRNLNNAGISPDVEADFPDDHSVRGSEKDPQLARALSNLHDRRNSGPQGVP